VPDLLYPDRRLAEFAARRGIDALPLAPLMQPLAERRGAYFHGFDNIGMGRGHWNADGHRIAAGLVAAHLCAGVVPSDRMASTAPRIAPANLAHP
jgi:hypothetical protein